MKKFKICPSCGTQNPPTVFECINCEADLTSVRATDGEITDIRQAVKAEKYRICECGAKNPPSARKCIECGEDISDIMPTEEKNSQKFLLTDSIYTFEITETPVIIGRESAMKDYLCSHGYVSRKHAEFTVSDGKLYVKNISRSNGTYINNIKIDNELHELKDGDEISLGGCTINGKRQSDAVYLTVRTKNCT